MADRFPGDGIGGYAFRAVFSRIKMHHLRLLLAIEQTGSLRGASEVLSITQPAVSKSLSELETLLNAELFERHARGVRPTRFCRPVLRYANLVSVNMQNMYDELSAIKTGKTGRIRVGTIMEPALGPVTQALRLMRETSPGVIFSVVVETSDTLAYLLGRNEIDVAIGRIPQNLDHAAFDFRTFGDERLAVVVAPGHPLAGRKIEPTETTAFPWILQPRPSPMRNLIDLWFERHHLDTPICQVETAALLMTMALLAGTETIAVLPRSVALHQAEAGLLSILPLDLGPEANPYGIITLRGRPVPEAMEFFIETMLAINSATDAPE